MGPDMPSKSSNSVPANLEQSADTSTKPPSTYQRGADTSADLLALDLETECALKCTERCDHALYPATANITCIGIWSPKLQYVFRGPDKIQRLKVFLASLRDFQITGHNLKFDLKMLYHHGYRWESLSQMYAHDSQIICSVSTNKVPEKYLKRHELLRKKANAKLPRGFSHRVGSPLSLKVLAPYLLGVEPFWEDPTNHDDDTYVLKDCEYSYKLTDNVSSELRKFGSWKFYSERLMPWARMLLEAEIRGVSLDQDLLDVKEQEAIQSAAKAKAELDTQWAAAYREYLIRQQQRLCEEYYLMCQAALAKLKDACTTKIASTMLRYAVLRDKAIEKIEPLNLDSPTQLAWLLRDFLGLDIKDFNDDESTGKEVLQRLSGTGREDIKSFLEYRTAKKLATAFFPTYRELQDCGVLHTSFNVTGTRTGRLSSNGPNLQQVPGHLHNLFRARPGHVLITRDEASIEPRIAAFYTQDPLLCDLMIKDGDFHSKNAIIMFGLDCPESEVKSKFPEERFVAKTCGLALLYGASPYRIQATALQRGFNWELGHCEEIYNNFKEAYSAAFNFKEDLDAMAMAGDPVTNLFGRVHSYRGMPRNFVFMRVFNTLVQSTASDLLLYSTYNAQQELRAKGIEAHPLLWVHDETVWETPEDRAREVEEIVERHLTCHKLSTQFGLIPLKCEGKTERFWAK